MLGSSWKRSGRLYKGRCSKSSHVRRRWSRLVKLLFFRLSWRSSTLLRFVLILLLEDWLRLLLGILFVTNYCLALLLKAATLMPIFTSKSCIRARSCLGIDKRAIGEALTVSQARLRSRSGDRIGISSCISPSWNIFAVTWRLNCTRVKRERSLTDGRSLEGTIQILKTSTSCDYHTAGTSKKHMIHVGQWLMHWSITRLVITDIKAALGLDLRVGHALVLQS
jgi:hypothetical protein